MSDQDQRINTDRELWRERDGDYYADSIHVTEHGGIGINCGGHVITKTLRAWHAADRETELRECFEEEVECAHKWLDTRGIPRADTGGEIFSLVGRMMRLVEQHQKP